MSWQPSSPHVLMQTRTLLAASRKQHKDAYGSHCLRPAYTSLCHFHISAPAPSRHHHPIPSGQVCITEASEIQKRRSEKSLSKRLCFYVLHITRNFFKSQRQISFFHDFVRINRKVSISFVFLCTLHKKLCSDHIQLFQDNAVRQTVLFPPSLCRFHNPSTALPPLLLPEV